MNDVAMTQDWELVCVIVNYGLGSKVMKVAKQHGITGGTIFLGKGTVHTYLLDLLDLTEVRKEIVLMAASKEIAYKTVEALNEKFQFAKPNHGIAFTLSVRFLLGSKKHIYNQADKNGGIKTPMHHAIFTVVDKGNAEAVIDAAVAAGSKGGTIINARGSGIHENSKLFSMLIEPEKEIVLILSEANATEAIVRSIRNALKIDEPGNGILFVLDVNQTYGLY